MQILKKSCSIGIILFVLFLGACEKIEPEMESIVGTFETSEGLGGSGSEIELKKSNEGHASLQLEQVPFSIELQEGQFVTICDIRNSCILGYIWHWNNGYTFALMDQIFVWNMTTQEVERLIGMDREYLFSTVLDQDGGIYIGCADVSDNKGEKWKLLYLSKDKNEFVSLKNGVSTLESGWGSPWLAHAGDKIACVYEEKEKNNQERFGSLIINGGELKELEKVEQSEDVRYPSYGIANGKDSFIYLIEKKNSLFIHIVKSDGEVLEFPWENKGYDFEMVGNHLIQSGQGEIDGQYVIYLHDIITGVREQYLVKSHGFRMQAAGEDSFYSVDSYYNVFYTTLEENRVEESFLEMPKELKNKAVNFLADEMENVYFIYEDIPDSNFPINIYKAKVE